MMDINTQVHLDLIHTALKATDKFLKVLRSQNMQRQVTQDKYQKSTFLLFWTMILRDLEILVN